MRLFVALEIPSAVRENLAALITELRELSSQPSWVRAENLHVTLKFIGSVEPEKLEAFHAALASVRSDTPVTLKFRGLGFFPNEKRARVFWAGIESSPNLKTLASNIDAATEKLDIPRESRPFSPHLTLARFEPQGMPKELRTAIQANMTREFGALQTRQFHLIESKLKRSGAEYTTLESFAFAGAEA